MNISKCITKAISKTGVTRKELCQRAGVTNPYLTWVIQGKISPKISTVERLAAGFNMSAIEFMKLGE